MWCAGVLGNCPKECGSRFHMTCLYCRWRRRYLGKYHNPPYWIRYTYLSWYAVNTVDSHTKNGVTYKRKDGGKLTVRYDYTLCIDPRGYFTALRCAIIVLIDKLASKHPKSKKTPRGYSVELPKPWAEICELLANYP